MFHIQVDKELFLAVLEKQHAEELFQLTDSSREYLREWLPWVDFTLSVEHSAQFIQAALEQYSHNDGFQLGIFQYGKLAGVIGLHHINWANKSTSIGYWLGEDFQGEGIMVRSCQAVIQYCFNELELHRIEIRAAVGNKKSQAVAEKLGFQREGCLRETEWLYDKYVDHLVYGLLEKEYRL